MSEIEHIKKILERERLARKEAERILEAKSLEIYEKSQEIETLKVTLQNKSAEELDILSRKQGLLDKLFKTHPLPIAIISSSNSQVVGINDQGLHLFGLKEEDIRKLKVKDLCDPIEVQVFDVTKKENNLDWLKSISKMRNTSGNTFNVEITMINSEFNGAASTVLLIEDLSEQLALKKQSEEHEQRYQNLIEKSSDLIYTINSEGFFTYMNPTGLNLLGYTFREIISMNFREIVKNTFKERVTSFYTYQLQSKTKTTYTEFPIVSKDGEEHWLGQNVDMSFEGVHVDISVVARDITEKKHLEREILKSEEKYRSIINNLELGLLEVDNDGIIQKAHPSFCKMVGFSKEEIEGTKGEFMLDEEAESIMTEQRLKREKGALGLYEIQLTKKSGEKIWVMISGAPTFDQNNQVNGSIGIHLNITEQKKLEKELRTAASVAKDSLKSKELFLANISHEMRTPLNGIIGLSELLNEDENLTLDLKSKTESILLSSKNLLNLIDDLLLFTKIENDKIEFNPDFVQLNTSVEGLMKTHEVAADSKKIKLLNNNNIPKNNNYFIDIYRLHQVLNNLLSNAIKFTNKGSVTMNTRVTYETKNFDVIEFEIIDTGIGIPEDEIDKIFGSFQQASNNDIQQNGGTGLGLSLVKKMTELMGGELDLETSENGTKFILEFQLNKSKNREELGQVDSPEKNNLAGLRILVAEDNKVNQQVVKNMLEKLSIDFDICADGKEAVDCFQSGSYDMILMDLRMPKLNGFEATEAVRTIDKTIPVIAATANTTIINKNDFLDKGFTDLLSKPFTQNDLIEILKKHTAKRNHNILSNLLNVTNENFQFSKELALIFIEDSTIRSNEIQEALQNKDLNKINSLCHSMKPSLLQLGDREIQRLVLELEKEESWTNKTKNRVSKFIEKLNAMIFEMEDKIVPELDVLS